MKKPQFKNLFNKFDVKSFTIVLFMLLVCAIVFFTMFGLNIFKNGLFVGSSRDINSSSSSGLSDRKKSECYYCVYDNRPLKGGGTTGLLGGGFTTEALCEVKAKYNLKFYKKSLAISIEDFFGNNPTVVKNMKNAFCDCPSVEVEFERHQSSLIAEHALSLRIPALVNYFNPKCTSINVLDTACSPADNLEQAKAVFASTVADLKKGNFRGKVTMWLSQNEYFSHPASDDEKAFYDVELKESDFPNWTAEDFKKIIELDKNLEYSTYVKNLVCTNGTGYKFSICAEPEKTVRTSIVADTCHKPNDKTEPCYIPLGSLNFIVDCIKNNQPHTQMCVPDPNAMNYIKEIQDYFKEKSALAGLWAEPVLDTTVCPTGTTR